jgi:hypothetical protein
VSGQARHALRTAEIACAVGSPLSDSVFVWGGGLSFFHRIRYTACLPPRSGTGLCRGRRQESSVRSRRLPGSPPGRVRGPCIPALARAAAQRERTTVHRRLHHGTHSHTRRHTAELHVHAPINHSLLLLLLLAWKRARRPPEERPRSHACAPPRAPHHHQPSRAPWPQQPVPPRTDRTCALAWPCPAAAHAVHASSRCTPAGRTSGSGAAGERR